MVESLSSENEWRGDDGAGEARPDAHKDVRTMYVYKQDAWPPAPASALQDRQFVAVDHGQPQPCTVFRIQGPSLGLFDRAI